MITLSYKTLYRTYRPQSFKDVVGQNHITQTFQNALARDKISHAYLFTGPRGTGKTTVAKIVAKAVNCKEAPAKEPCNQCPSCLSINQGFDNDIFEIDAASNNGVDEIRELRDKIKYAPTTGRYKVYIIDEVHMLSKGAFNALLKTLEEPPQHALFILATTEPHKIPATIISRCQRFDFRSISVKDIMKRLKDVMTQEGIEIDEKALVAIAQTARGGMRDALSLLDQVISYSDDENHITEDDVHAVAGTVSEKDLSHIVGLLADRKPHFAIEAINELVSLGKEPLRIIEYLIYYCRDLFLIKKMPNIERELVTHHGEDTIELSQELNENLIYDIISVLNDIQYEMRKTNTPRVFLELAVFEIDRIVRENTGRNEVKRETTQTTAPERTVEPSKQTQRIEVRKKETHSTRDEMDRLVDEDALISNLADENPISQSLDDSSDFRKPDSHVTASSQLSVNTENFEERFIDVKEIEYILNNGNKEKKERLLHLWSTIFGTDIDYMAIEQLLLEGKLEAVSVDNQLLLSYEQDEMCARFYEQDVYEKAVEILKKAFGETFSIVVIPQRHWQAKFNEFVEQFKKGIKEPKLTPIDEPIIVRRAQSNYEHEPNMVKEIINIFGEEIVEIKN